MILNIKLTKNKKKLNQTLPYCIRKWSL